MIYSSNIFDFYASPNKEFRMINNNSILKLNEQLKRYCIAIFENNALRNASNLSKLLVTFNGSEL